MNTPHQTTMKAVIVDDEELSRSLLREFLAGHPEVEIVAECANGFEAVQAVNNLHPDLLFLDVQMPKLNGFEVLELIGQDVGVIFVTAYDQYALRAFDVHAIDYLLKPFGAERLAQALERARVKLTRPERLPVSKVIADARPPGTFHERVLIRSGPHVHVIPVEDLDYVQAQDDYVAFKVSGKEFLKQQTLGELETQLDPSRFVRIHRSYILNIERLARIELYAKDSHTAILRDGTQLPISRAGYSKLSSLLG
jgi:two-component system LytT family response regulator